jgi:hypothetical protein
MLAWIFNITVCTEPTLMYLPIATKTYTTSSHQDAIIDQFEMYDHPPLEKLSHLTLARDMQP